MRRRRGRGALSGMVHHEDFAGRTSSTSTTRAGRAVGVCAVFDVDGECVATTTRRVAPRCTTSRTSRATTRRGRRPRPGRGRLRLARLTRRRLLRLVDDGALHRRRLGRRRLAVSHERRQRLPTAYGAAYDGSCIVALGDPGQVFTVDPAGSSPCLSLTTGAERTTVDLRDQRCDGGVGGAAGRRYSWRMPSPASSSSVTVTVRDAATGGSQDGRPARLRRHARPVRHRSRRAPVDRRRRARRQRRWRGRMGRRDPAADRRRLARRSPPAVRRDGRRCGLRRRHAEPAGPDREPRWPGRRAVRQDG